jgi:hypothetical protein
MNKISRVLRKAEKKGKKRKAVVVLPFCRYATLYRSAGLQAATNGRTTKAEHEEKKKKKKIKDLIKGTWLSWL